MRRAVDMECAIPDASRVARKRRLCSTQSGQRSCSASRRSISAAHAMCSAILWATKASCSGVGFHPSSTA